MLYNRFVAFFRNHIQPTLTKLIKDDKLYLSIVYLVCFKRRLNWRNPKSFNEKMQWLKLYKHKPIYVTMADKYAVKTLVAELIGQEYVVPNLGVWDSVDEIDFANLPNQFVLKCTHDSGSRYICKDKMNLDIEKAKQILSKGLQTDYYLPGRDKQYRDIPRRIIADTYLEDNTGEELRDYKFWCFNGEPVYMYCTNKGEYICENFYDMDFKPVPINHGFPRILPELEKPDEFELMRDLSRKLSKGVPCVRVDFFDVNHHVYFGEYTFFDWGGWRPFLDGWDEKLGELININEV